MKKKIMKRMGLPLAAVTLMIGAAACNGRGDNEIAFEPYEFDVVGLTADSNMSTLPGSKYIRLGGRGMLPTHIGDADIQSLRDTLMTLGRMQLDDNGKATTRPTKGVTLTELSPDSTDCCSQIYSRVTVVLTTPTVCVWRVFNSGIMCGAPHGMYATHYINYSLISHRVLKLSDIMRKGYERPLLDMLRQKLAEKYELIVSPQEIKISDNFRFDADGITFTYGLYEVAPYSEGEPEVSLSSWELIDLLTPEAFQRLTGQAGV